MAERVKQSRFPRIGITDEGDRSQRHRLAGLTGQRSLPPQRLNRRTDASHALANAAAVCFERFLAGTSCANAASEPREFRARSGKPRQEIIELRQFHL